MSGEAVDQRERRIGRNEALFRVVNERLKGLNEGFGMLTKDFQIVCECGDETCVEQILIAADEYSRIRADATLFVLVHGHEDATAEAVVEEDQAAYLVVRKRPGAPAVQAAQNAPDA
jgi:hypothetical protein